MNPLWLTPLVLAAEPTVLTLDEALRLVEAANRPAPEKLPPAYTVASSVLTLRVEGELVRVRQVLRIEVSRPTWVDLPVLDGQVRLEGQSAAFRQGPDGHWWLTTRLQGPATFALGGTVPAKGASLKLRVAPGVRQEVHTEGEGLAFDVDGLVAGGLSPTDTVSVRWRPDAPKAAAREVVLGESVAAIWVEDDALRGRARVRFEVRRGERKRFALRLPAGARELRVEGAGLLRWDASGDRVELQARESVRGAFEVVVEWRQAFQGDKARLSAPEPLDVSSVAATLTLAGSSESLLSPSAGSGLRAVALSELPDRDRAIGDAPPAAAWVGRGVVEVRTLRLEAIEGPALVIDRVNCTAAYAESGRALMNCALDVRNVSRQYLVVEPGEGTSLWAARVNGDGVPPVVLDDGRMAIPLEKSVETVAGLLTLDVQLTFFAEGAAWERRKGEQSLALPSFDAPVARLDWELRLPPGFEGEVGGGTARLAREADTSMVYASSGTPLSAEQLAARESANQALRAYQSNDFEAAQTYVQETLALDPGNANAVLLQGNLDVLGGQSGADEAMSRRVKDLAKAKVAEDEIAQEQVMREAQDALDSGDYDRAMKAAEEAVKLSKDLSRYEQAESNEQSYRASSSAELYKKADARKREQQAPAGGAAPVASPTPTPAMVEERQLVVVEERYLLIEEEPPEEPSPMDDAELLIVDDEDIGDLISAGGLGMRGSGLGGGGTAEGLGGLGTKGRGSGGSGYGSGGGSFGGETASPRPATAEPIVDEVVVTESSGAVLDKEYFQTVATGRSYQSAVQVLPGVTRRDVGGGKEGKASKVSGAIPTAPPIAATTLAVPLPDHGQHLNLSRSLLQPGENASVVVRYKRLR